MMIKAATALAVALLTQSTVFALDLGEEIDAAQAVLDEVQTQTDPLDTAQALVDEARAMLALCDEVAEWGEDPATLLVDPGKLSTNIATARDYIRNSVLACASAGFKMQELEAVDMPALQADLAFWAQALANAQAIPFPQDPSEQNEWHTRIFVYSAFKNEAQSALTYAEQLPDAIEVKIGEADLWQQAAANSMKAAVDGRDDSPLGPLQ